MMAQGFWGSGPNSSPDDGFFRRLPAFSGKRTRAKPGGDSAEALLHLKSFEESCHGWFWSTDAAGNLTYLSSGIVDLLGAPESGFLGSRFADIFGRADDDITGRGTLPFVLARHSSFQKLILRASVGDASRCWSVSGSAQFDESGGFTGYRGSAVDVTEHRRSSEHATHLAKYDALTGLPNRLRMSEILCANLEEARHHSKPCAVMLIDLDRFKQVNDTLGHPAGDALLCQVAERLVKIVGNKEKVFRLGGDEFQVILQNCENRGIIGDLATDIISGLSQPYLIESSRCVIGASIGIAIAPTDGATKDEVMRNADLALYASKEAGRGRFRFFSNELLESAEEKRFLEDDLRDALARGEISLAYQPVMNATTNRMTGVEALLRWEHPQRGSVSPTLFIPIAEEAGLIGQLGDWALRTACHAAASWPSQLRVAVNVSPLQFMNESFPSTVESALAAAGLPPDRLELEITEGVFLGEGQETDSMFAALKEIGVRLALDDFGTGYSSLGYLRSAPFDKIKIDQTFVRAATLPGSRNSAIIAAIVALADALEMETTAEGVEYMDQLRLVRSLKVSHIQGWVYSKAVSAGELGDRLERGDWVIEPSGPAKQRSERQATLRKVGVIHGGRYDSVIMRNISDSGALIDGIAGLRTGTLIVVDFGDGELAFSRVTRAVGSQQGIAFEQPLVDDGNGGLCTSHRVSPYLLTTCGLPSPGDPEKAADFNQASVSFEELAKKLGLTLPAEREEVIPADAHRSESEAQTFGQLSARFLESLSGDEQLHESAKRDVRNHVLPRFGQLRLDQISQADIFAWLAAKIEVEDHRPGTDSRLHQLLGDMWALASDLGIDGAEPNPLKDHVWVERRTVREGTLTHADAVHLLEAARVSHNRHLKFIIALLMATGVRLGELLKAKWDQIDLEKAVWRLRNRSGEVLEVALTPVALELLAMLPRWEDCPYVIANPVTRRPYHSVSKSWDVARIKAGLPYTEISDLRFCDIGSEEWRNELVGLIGLEPALGRSDTAGDAAAPTLHLPDAPVSADQLPRAA